MAGDQPDERGFLLSKEGEAAELTPSRERSIIRHIAYFVTLAEEGHFHRAAQQLGISQSALTRRIQTLERELGIDLFARTQRAAKLTAAGHSLHEAAQRILNDLRSATRRAQLVSRGEGGDINIATTDFGLRSPIVVAALGAFKRRNPDVKIHLQAIPSEAQLISLKRKDIDLALLFDVVLDRASRRVIDLLPLAKAPRRLAVHRTHRLAALSRVRLSDLRDEELAWPSRRAGRSVSDEMVATFRAAGVSPQIAIEVMTDETTLNLAAADLGIGFVLDVGRPPPDVVLLPVEGHDFDLVLHAAWLKGETQAGTMLVLHELQRQVDAHNAVSR